MKCIYAFFLSSLTMFAQPVWVTGQAARAEIGQPNFTAQNTADSTQTPPIKPSASLLGAAGGVAYANNTLFVLDSNRLQAAPIQNRLLIYNNISAQVPAANAQLVTSGVRCPVCLATGTLVVGQTEFTSSDPGLTASTMNTPVGVATDGKILAIADTNSNRVLVYNPIPTQNGASASVVLGQKDFTSIQSAANLSSSTLRGPEGMWISNGKLFVADTNNNRVLIWNSIPTSNNQAADVVLGQPSFTSASPATHPPINAQTMSFPVSVSSDGTHVFVTDLGNNRILIWNSIPTQNGQAADVEIGQPDFSTGDANHVANICPSTGSGSSIVYPYECAATLNYPRFVLSDGTRLYIADGGNDRVIIFNTIPTTNGARGNRILGQLDEYSNIIANGTNTSRFITNLNQSSASTMITPTALAWDGENLYVTDPFNRRVLVFTPGYNLVPNTGITNAASLEVFALGSILFALVATTDTPTAGDTVTITVKSATYTYKVVKNDTLATIIQALVSKINSSNSGAGDPNVLAIDNSGADEIVLSAKASGPSGDNITYSATTTSTTFTITTAAANLAGGQNASQIAPGTLISVFAYGGLTDQSPASAPANKPLPLQLAGVELYVDGMRAPLMYVSDKQINAQMPFEVADANGVTTWVRSTFKNGAVMITAATGAPIVPGNPGIFANPGKQPQAAIAVHGSNYGITVVSVDGTVKSGDVGTITIRSTAYSYTVQAADTLTSIENAFIKMINKDKNAPVTASAAGAFNRIIFTAKVPGNAGINITITPSVSTGAHLLLTGLGQTSGTGVATCCVNTAGALLTTSNPAIPDETIYIYATGLGLVHDASGNLQGVTGQPYKGPLTNAQQSVDALINGSSTANVLETGLAPGMVGIYLVRLQLGSNLTTNLASQLRIAQGLNTSNIVTIPVKVP